MAATIIDCPVCGQGHETQTAKMFGITYATCPELRPDEQAIIYGPSGANPFVDVQRKTESEASEMNEYPVKCVAEIAFDEHGEVLWVERYIFKRIHGVGDTFVKDSQTYEVIGSFISHGKYGGALVEHVCKKRA